MKHAAVLAITEPCSQLIWTAMTTDISDAPLSRSKPKVALDVCLRVEMPLLLDLPNNFADKRPRTPQPSTRLRVETQL